MALPSTAAALLKHLKEYMPEHDAYYVIEKRAGLPKAAILSRPDADIEEAALKHIHDDLNAYKAGKPLSRIYGERHFWDFKVGLSDATLDPRPDTETLIDAVIKHYEGKAPPQRILDLGTGSGCILLALLRVFPNAGGVGIDISEDAVQTAQKNAESLNLDSRSTFSQGNWTDNVDETFDLVVSNPPYITNLAYESLDENVKNYDPILALKAGEDGLQAYKEIFSSLFSVLKGDGIAFFEIGFDQKDSITRLSEESRFLVRNVHTDLAGHPRVLELCANHISGDK